MFVTDMETEIRTNAAMDRSAIEALEEAINHWKRHMQIREMSHDRYYTDPYGRAADMAHLRLLEQQLEVA